MSTPNGRSPHNVDGGTLPATRPMRDTADVSVALSRPPAADRRNRLIGVATFAGGSFRRLERVFRAVPGVIETTRGYTGGTVANPSYARVATGITGHAEAVRVEFDPARVSYEEEPGDKGPTRPGPESAAAHVSARRSSSTRSSRSKQRRRPLPHGRPFSADPW